jgi:predicted nucleotidyltransferase
MSHPEIKDIWYRNSFCFDYWKFLRSDIDITIVLEKSKRDLIKEISYTHSVFRKFLPIIGELLIYSEDLKLSLLECVNTYELERDPFLMEQYVLVKRPDHYEKIVFLHKFLVANWSKKNIDQKRPEKIAYYMDQINLSPPRAFIDLVDDLAILLGLDQVEFKKQYIKQMERENDPQEIDFSAVIHALFYNKLCYLKMDGPLDINEKKILEKIVLWELWGCYSYQGSAEFINLQDHLKRLIGGLEQLTSQEFSNHCQILAKKLGLL